ncbi:type II toxin-antitoxin system RelE/ParE family toxin [Gloeobacter kilaueensis]|uniref:Plasmid stabilization system n=1 Tax=Gloeobacter kilaueensis (strain ATCC BAA-2537 / CCAP 1431/1 / ULC 316 / JS1) TaxID=1183438 RepID=U5QJA3_GLOK1|nr:type II toxin-antitoxin system RelE/ParE family toxin [Gloeobacter kilaueensis]AGY59062.1 plasmid stabilization system [Gloeobacter kilaueensis JS1]
MQVVLSKRAELDLEEITSFIALDDPAAAERFEDKLLEHTRAIGLAPLAYRARPDLGANIRSCAHGRYLIFSPLIQAR